MMHKKNNSAHGVIIFLLAVLIVLQGIQVYYVMNPATQPVVQGITKEAQKQQKEHKELLEKVSKHTEVKENEQALIVSVDNVKKLQEANPLNAEIYKDAQDGDRVIGFQDRMIIYRESEDKIIYEGKSPAHVQQEQYMAELQAIIPELNKLISIDLQARPRLLTVVDPDKLKSENPKLYSNVIVGDKVLIYQDRVIIYRPSTKSIVTDKTINEIK